MTVMPYPEMLKIAQRWSLEDQMRLAEALLRNLRLALRRQPPSVVETSLVPLSDMSLGELRALADAVVAPGSQQRLHDLLEKNRNSNLSPEEEQILDALLDEADQVALLKARARYTLQVSGMNVEANR
jgi:hypothetical protein